MERVWKDQLYQEFARIGKCLSSPKRLELLDLLSQGPKSVDQLAKTTGMSVANVSQHLQTLHESRLVRSHKQGNFVIYGIAESSVADFMVSLHRLSEKQLVEVQKLKSDILQAHVSMEPIALEELLERMEKGEVLLLDVRPEEEYLAGHIPGAISVPIEELEEHLASLPADKEIVAYCRGPYCLMSAQAVEILKSKGIKASRLEEGVHEWKRYAEFKQ
ncbi:Rhodanese-related sulfurtransferase [Paenibacillus sp. UNCCL117]|uniref:ArsR/SmtB family transcription factor n=1 Tax=unclassified Paenibacillus TaxID=185978 RepID=UPI000883F150|nr:MULTISPECIES: metalloregulator ArsR/SmtB family transcription factor [unclassified Paenibacillus]SDE15098.1 Rhodanese-related sulfurtransferase [Paenibacillus sp. cl123]SFW60799.1 Rhodanese-related sulfurtransferase [Paenibacillus sp. UNCCL117]